MKILAWAVIPAVLFTACIQSHRAPPVVYTVPATELTPTSDNPNPRVYVPANPSDASAADLALASSVSAALNNDPEFAGISQNLAVTAKNGVVTLRGGTPSENSRVSIVERVRKLPGVVRVHDHLGITGER